MSEERKKSKMVTITVPLDPNDMLNTQYHITINGDTKTVERGVPTEVPEEYAEIYYHRLRMGVRKRNERNRRAQELREKQNKEGVSFM